MNTHNRIIAVALCCLFVACNNAPSNQASELKWGHLKPSSNHLIHLPDHSEIRVCGSHYEMIKEAINTWAAIINRNFKVKYSCTNAHIYSYGSHQSHTQKKCELYNYENRMFVYDELHPQELYDCDKKPSRLRPSILHEVGHLFGLCDQYPGQIEKCATSTAPDHQSIMKDTYGNNSLGIDDITGIRALAKKYSGETDRFDLLEGSYRNDRGTIWHLSIDKTYSGALKAITVDKKWPYICDWFGICSSNTSKIIFLDSKRVQYLHSDDTSYQFEWVSKD